MTRKQVQTIIEQNSNKGLYLAYGTNQNAPKDLPRLTFHDKVSKTTLLRNAKHIHSVKYSTYGEERPDLVRYASRIKEWNEPIVTFDAR